MYCVWTKAQYADNWERCDCGDLEAVKREVLKATQDGREVEVTQPMVFSIEVKVREFDLEAHSRSRGIKTTKELSQMEAEDGEADQGGPEENQGPGGEGNGSV